MKSTNRKRIALFRQNVVQMKWHVLIGLIYIFVVKRRGVHYLFVKCHYRYIVSYAVAI
jgi:hypothetical protein